MDMNNEQTASHEDVVDDLKYDLFNLCASNYHPLRWKNDSKREDVILDESTRAVQLLYRKLSKLPKESSEIGPVTKLPTESVPMPRFHKIPEPKPETKWEKFAREKGIQKKKSDRMIYDEDTGEYKPRFGYKRGKNGIEDIPIVEVKPGDDPYADPWSEEKKSKKERVEKNQKNQIKNEFRAQKSKGGNKSASFDPVKTPGIPLDMNTTQNKRGKAGVKSALKLAQVSTASMGRFDNYRPGEPERKLSGNKRKFRDNNESVDFERAAMKAQIRLIEDKVSKKAKGVTNSISAYEGILPDAPTLAFKKSKGKGKVQSGSKKKGK